MLFSLRYSQPDIEQVLREKKPFILRCMLDYIKKLPALLEARISLTRLLTLGFGKRRRRKSSGSGRSSGGAGAVADDRGHDGICVDERELISLDDTPVRVLSCIKG